MNRRVKRIRNKERLWVFRAELAKLYDEHEAKLEALSKKHGVEINFWYNPSKIPQPTFMIEGVTLNADTLYDEKEFTLMYSPNIIMNKTQSITNKLKRKIFDQSITNPY